MAATTQKHSLCSIRCGYWWKAWYPVTQESLLNQAARPFWAPHATHDQLWCNTIWKMMPDTGKTHPREHGWGVHNNLVEASTKSHQSDGRCGKYRIIYVIYRKEWNTLLFAIHQQHCPMIHTDYALRCNTLQTQSLSTITWSCIWGQHRRWRKLRQPESLIPHLPTSCIFFYQQRLWWA